MSFSQLQTPSRAGILALAWPIILANCAAPLLGLVDTAVIGNFGQAQELGAIALGALIFSFVFWAFGFLRMATSGFAAQAAGAGDREEERAILARSGLIALLLGTLIVLFQALLLQFALALLQGSPAVEAYTAEYFHIRVWSAPATLLNYALVGLLIGLGCTRQVLLIQLLLNLLNMLLDVYFVVVLDWGVAGVALGTALAEVAAALLALTLVVRLLRARQTDRADFWPWASVFEPGAMAKTLSANRDLMIRTLLMLAAFAWFTNQSAQFGDAALAANHILLQFISLSAFFLDGFAFAAEGQVGQAIGAQSRTAFRAAVRYSTQLSALAAALMAATLWLSGELIIGLLTDLPVVRSNAVLYLPYACIYVLLSFAAFQLDGIFIGGAQARMMRNASLASVLGFALISMVSGATVSLPALWMSFLAYVVLRAVCLVLAYPALRVAVFPAREPQN